MALDVFSYSQTAGEAVFDPATRTYVKPEEKRPLDKPKRMLTKVIFSCKRCSLQWSGRGAHHPASIHAEFTGHRITRLEKRP